MDNKISSATLADVARRAGVSTATAGRALGRYGNVSEKTEEIVLAAAKEIGYSPNEIARGLRSRKTRSIAVVVGSISNNFFSRVINAIEIEAREHGYSVLICNSHENVTVETLQLQAMHSHKVDGIIISSAYTLSEIKENSSRELYVSDIPVVLIDRFVENVKAPLISSDNFGGGYEATMYLAGLGHKRIGVIGTGDYSTISDRIGGYRKALEDSGISYDADIVAAIPTSDDVVLGKLVRDYMAKAPGLTACMVLDNSLCTPLLIYLNEAGKKVPQDISLVTWDDSNVNKLLGITTVEQFPEKIGSRAVRRLIDRLEGKESSGDRLNDENDTIDVELIIRSSCKKLG